jgi:hypothetical protein
MSIRAWLNSPQPKTPGLINPRDCKTSNEAELISDDNVSVDKQNENRKRKRGEYRQYDETLQAKIAVYAIDNGVIEC